MKAIVNKLLAFTFFLFGILNGMAKATPPAPNQKTNIPPTPVGLPINENLFYLLILAVFFGIYIIYTHNLEGKKSV